MEEVAQDLEHLAAKIRSGKIRVAGYESPMIGIMRGQRRIVLVSDIEETDIQQQTELTYYKDRCKQLDDILTNFDREVSNVINEWAEDRKKRREGRT